MNKMYAFLCVLLGTILSYNMSKKVNLQPHSIENIKEKILKNDCRFGIQSLKMVSEEEEEARAMVVNYAYAVLYCHKMERREQ